MKMGRPRKPEIRDRQLNLSLTEREYEGLRKRAEAVGMRPVHFGRAMLVNTDTARKAAIEPGDNRVQLMYGQLVRVGNNLNQLVRHLHRTGDHMPADLEPLLRDIRQLISRVTK
jgi:Bacterial mobilisation protein (MobC)